MENMPTTVAADVNVTGAVKPASLVPGGVKAGGAVTCFRTFACARRRRITARSRNRLTALSTPTKTTAATRKDIGDPLR
ncbi:hypothetical protein GCM10020001_035590 [Nonomuraea salmonea]